MLRHWRTCQDRLKSGLRPPVLPLKKRGRKLNACTRCAQLKKKCSGALPCVTCAEQNQQCSYARPSTIKTTTCREKEDEIAVPPVLPIEQDLNNHEVQSSEMTMPDAEFLWADLMNGKMSDLWSLSPPPIPWTDLINYPTQVGYPTTPLLGQEKFSDISSGMVDDHTSMFNYRLNGSSSSPVCPSLAPKPNLLRLDIRFLANFTSTHGMANSFEIGNCLARRRVMSNLAQNRNMLSMTRSYGKGSGNAGVADLWLGSSRGVGQSSSGNNRYDWHFASQQPDIPDNVSSLSRRGGDGHPLASKSREIIRGIQETTCSKMPYRTTTINWSQSAERSCARFFSPLNLEKFTRAFWHFWNPNWPVFHRPTFEASQKPAQLIAALSLVGACVSPEKIDRDQAMSWLEAVEDWVFSDPDFSEDMIPQTDDESQLSQIGTRLDSIRAAYALLIIMTWEGNEKQMTRARRTQFTQTVSVSRSLYFFCTAQDAAYDESSADSRSQWMLYALREECIRTLIYVFLLDCAFVMFNNSAPRMVISELQFSLTSPEVWFHAPNPHNWLGCVQKSPRVDEGMSLSEAVGRMMHSDLDATECKIFQQTNLLNHFAITSGMYLGKAHNNLMAESHAYKIIQPFITLFSIIITG